MIKCYDITGTISVTCALYANGKKNKTKANAIRKTIKINEYESIMEKIFACKTDDVKPGTMKKVTMDGKEIVVTNLNGEFFACSDTCTHSGASLSEGTVDDHKIICGWHGAQFDCRTGNLEKFPVTINNLQSYTVTKESDNIMIEV